MPGGLQAQQIVNMAGQIAGVPGFTQLAGQLLNGILAELCVNYDFQICKKFFQFNFNPGLISSNSNAQPGSGPYAMPADYLRMAGPRESFWTLLGVPYPMVPIDMEAFDNTVQQPGLQSYSYAYTVDMSQTPPGMYIYPPPSGSFPANVRYFSLMPDIATPESSTVVPWFPDTTYLYTRLAGELMKITGDTRAGQTLGTGDDGAQGILTRYLKMEGDKGVRAINVKLDRRQFGKQWQNLRTTKIVGW